MDDQIRLLYKLILKQKYTIKVDKIFDDGVYGLALYEDQVNMRYTNGNPWLSAYILMGQ